MGMSRRGRSPDETEFEDFVAAAWSNLVWYGYLLCGDHSLAEDLAQETLKRTYSRWSRVRTGLAHAYARKTLSNLNVDRLRRERSTAPLQDPTHGGTAQADPLDVVEDRDQAVRLLGPLTRRERQVLVLRYLYDLTEVQVAEELGVALGTVKSAHARALKRLRDSGQQENRNDTGKVRR